MPERGDRRGGRLAERDQRLNRERGGVLVLGGCRAGLCSVGAVGGERAIGALLREQPVHRRRVGSVAGRKQPDDGQTLAVDAVVGRVLRTEEADIRGGDDGDRGGCCRNRGAGEGDRSAGSKGDYPEGAGDQLTHGAWGRPGPAEVVWVTC